MLLERVVQTWIERDERVPPSGTTSNTIDTRINVALTTCAPKCSASADRGRRSAAGKGERRECLWKFRDRLPYGKTARILRKFRKRFSVESVGPRKDLPAPVARFAMAPLIATRAMRRLFSEKICLHRNTLRRFARKAPIAKFREPLRASKLRDFA